MQETWVWSLGQEDPLEKEMATHSSILAWEIPWTEEPSTVYWVTKESDLMTDHHTRLQMVITMVWSLNWGTGIRLENAEPAEVTTEEPGPRELHFCLQLVLVRNDRILPNSPRFA